jgi:hypothetical protein
VLIETFGALVLSATPAMSFEQPPASTVLALVSPRGEARPLRLNLPSIVETVRLESNRRLLLSARPAVPASLDLAGERIAAQVSLSAALGSTIEGGRVRTSRSFTITADGLELVLLADVVLAPNPASLGAGEMLVEKLAIVSVSKATGRVADFELARHAFLAHPKVPMRWTPPGSVAKWKAETREGWLVLGAGLYPEVFVDGQEVTISMAEGENAKRWRLRVENGAWTDGERVIEWTEEPGRWIGRVRGFDTHPLDSMRLGDASSPMSVDFVSSLVPVGERAGL